MEEPPDEDDRRNDEQAEGLVATEESALFSAALVFGQLLLIGLDAAFDHACALFGGSAGRAPVHKHKYRRCRRTNLRRHDVGLREKVEQTRARGIVDEGGADCFELQAVSCSSVQAK